MIMMLIGLDWLIKGRIEMASSSLSCKQYKHIRLCKSYDKIHKSSTTTQQTKRWSEAITTTHETKEQHKTQHTQSGQERHLQQAVSEINDTKQPHSNTQSIAISITHSSVYWAEIISHNSSICSSLSSHTHTLSLSHTHIHTQLLLLLLNTQTLGDDLTMMMTTTTVKMMVVERLNEKGKQCDQW